MEFHLAAFAFVLKASLHAFIADDIPWIAHGMQTIRNRPEWFGRSGACLY
jgi:hypothetical protein